MQALALMRPQPAEIHFGANTVLVIEQGEDLLVVIDQRA
jgi:virulence-associated protein VagC